MTAPIARPRRRLHVLLAYPLAMSFANLTFGANGDYLLGIDDIGLSINADYEHQEFEETNGDVYSLRLTPHAIYEKWLFAADFTYQRVDGTTIVSRGRYVNVLCDALANDRPLPPGIERNARRSEDFLDRLIDRCGASNMVWEDTTSKTSEAGLGDIALFANYATQLDTEGVWLGAVTGGYVADNGDEKKGLGSGTHDAYLEAAFSGDFNQLSTRFLLGYNSILGGEWGRYFDNYAYGSVEVSTPARAEWVTGANLYVQEADFEEGEQVRKLTVFTEWQGNGPMSLRVYYSDYSADTLYPQASAGASVYFHF